MDQRMAGHHHHHRLRTHPRLERMENPRHPPARITSALEHAVGPDATSIQATIIAAVQANDVVPVLTAGMYAYGRQPEGIHERVHAR